MRVFVAGATGVIGRPLVTRLRTEGHEVGAITRSTDRARALSAIGVEAVACDVYDMDALRKAVVAAKPDAVVHELTALPKRLRPRKVAADAAATNRLRREGTKNLLAAAVAAGARRFVAQSIVFVTRPAGPAVLDETAPLYLDADVTFRPVVAAVAELEERVVAAKGLEGLCLRYGFFYGEGTAYDEGGMLSVDIDRRRVPIVGDGAGVFSFVHVEDAAAATVHALGQGDAGIYNVTDDEPAPAREWIPELARLRGAPRPRRVPAWVARLGAGAYAVYLMTEQRGASNAKAKRVLGWSPSRPSWREGFMQEIARARRA